jgi:hypothetical protein
MIGFEMEAWGSNGFKQKRSAWTEGSLMALKVSSTVGSMAEKSGLGLPRGGVISQIEASFKKLAYNKFKNTCSCGLSFSLFLTGDYNFKYYFDANKDSSQTRSELYNLFASQADKIGDQVIIYFCSIVDDFVLLNFDSSEPNLVLTIEIDL